MDKVPSYIAGNSKHRQFFRVSTAIIDTTSLFALLALFVAQLPLSIFNNAPASGGDTLSHFWPLVTLTRYGLPEFSPRVWNPGNLGGEPQLVNYFPFPYLVMSFLSIFVSLPRAFNFGILIAMLLLPFTTYAGLRLCGFRFPAPILGAVFSAFALYNESYSMWGGNMVSTLAGQFAHLYALDLLPLAIGFLVYELRKAKFPRLSSICFACVATSHSYVFLGVPFFLLSALVSVKKGKLWQRLLICNLAGILALLLAAWFIVPMIDNAPWTTAFAITWAPDKLLEEALPPIFLSRHRVLFCRIQFSALKTPHWRSPLSLVSPP